MSTNPVTKLIGPGSTQASQTLYDRIGGEPKLDSIVTGVYNAMRADKVLGKQLARFRLERLKDRTVDYFRGEWGGAEPYKGPDLWISHSHLGVSNQWYDIMMKYYVETLKKENIAKQETKEILESLEKMRAPIVDRDHNFKNLYLKHVEREAARAGGDGVGSVAATQKECEAKERAAIEQTALQERRELEGEERRRVRALDEQERAKKGAKPWAAPADAKAAPACRQAHLAPLDNLAPEAKPAPKESQPKPRPEPKQPTVDAALFVFSPAEDAPPSGLPSSQPSGAELLYRWSVPCPVR